MEATKIQSTYKNYKERLMKQASLLAIINAIRESQRHVAAVTIQDAFRAKPQTVLLGLSPIVQQVVVLITRVAVIV